MRSDTVLAEYERVQQRKAERQHLRGTRVEEEESEEPERGRKKKAKRSL